MQELRAWLSRLSRLNNSVLDARSADRSSTSSEDAVLGALLLAGPILNPSALKTIVIQSPGGLTKTLLRLERAGHVRRASDPADRRALLVELTSSGRRAAKEATEAVDAYYEELLMDLDLAEREQLTCLVRKVLDKLESISDMPSDPLVSAMLRPVGLQRR